VQLDFYKSVRINSEQKLNDSTWKLTILTPADEFCQIYGLSLLGSGYSVFIKNKSEQLTVFIDTTFEKSSPYRVTPAKQSTFSFGIDWGNATDHLPVPKDSSSIAAQIATIQNEAKKIKQKYGREIAHNPAFASYVDNQILRTIWNSNRKPFAETMAGKAVLDSLTLLFKTASQKTIVCSSASVLLGNYLLGEQNRNNINDINCVRLIEEKTKSVPSGIFRDAIVENYFRSATYNPNISGSGIDSLFQYATLMIKNKEVFQFLNTEHQRYINEHQRLPESVLDSTQLTDYAGRTISLKQLLDDLKAKGKTKIVIDFWASWCVPCRQEIAESGAFLDSIRKQDPSFEYICFSVDVPEKYAEAKDFAKQYDFVQNNFFLVGAHGSPLREYYKISAIPYHLLINPGTLKTRANIRGPWMKEDFVKELSKE
jgi:thiol-disulfide isomerase/thioredoxin